MTLPLFETFCLLAAVTVGLALYAARIVRVKGDECLHLMDAGVSQIKKQEAGAHRLHAIGLWEKILALATLLTGIAAYCSWWLRP
jgi:hypothetical protein